MSIWSDAPEEEKDSNVTYPPTTARSAERAKTVRFKVQVKAVRRKELPEMNDEFARDLGDYQKLDELREAIRKVIFAERSLRRSRKRRKARGFPDSRQMSSGTPGLRRFSD